MLKWSLKYISGRFENGKLEGSTLLVTWRGLILYATFKNGELHGPMHSYGRKLLFDFEVLYPRQCSLKIEPQQSFWVFFLNRTPLFIYLLKSPLYEGFF